MFYQVSLQSLGISCLFQAIILLYLYDEDTVWLVLASSALGLLIDLWKLSRACTLKV
jgi:hypothetical protein